MQDTINNAMDNAWNYIWDKLFCPESKMFYDYITSREQSKRFGHLPTAEDIAANLPNPCGWGTGMEDCMLNAGSVMDILRIRKQLTGEDNLASAIAVAEGIVRCATRHNKNGFIVRGMSYPAIQSCYTNSSLDQFTLAIYGAWRFIDSYQEAPASVLKTVREVICACADYCTETVTSQNDFNLLRLDGKKAQVSKIWHCSCHEYMRLPMIYTAAFNISGKKRYLDLANQYIHEALEKTSLLDNKDEWWDIPIVQMQISLYLVLESGVFPEMNEELSGIMDKVADFAGIELNKELKNAEDFQGNWCELNTDWRTNRIFIQYGGIRGNGEGYRNPVFPDSYAISNAILREIGNYLTTVALSPAKEPEAATLERVEEFLTKVDYLNYAGDAPVKLLHAYWSVMRRKAVITV